MRSKGFLWLASSHDAAYYWSHAGNHFAAELMGRWWATLPEDRYPEDMRSSILSDFDGEDGDRRQEIVFIGVGAVAQQAAITEALDACLLTDDEMAAYRAADDDARPEPFPSDLRVRAWLSLPNRFLICVTEACGSRGDGDLVLGRTRTRRTKLCKLC